MPPCSFGSEISRNRGRNEELSLAIRASIISKWEMGVPQTKLADEFGCHRNAIGKTIKRWKQYHTLESLPREGRPPLINRREKRLLVRIARKYPKLEYKKLMEDAGLLHQHHPPSRLTIYRNLKSVGLTNHKCVKKPKLNRAHAALRLRFAREYRNFNWHRRVVKFSDECSVQRGSGQDAEWCFRYPHEKYDPKMITEKEKAKRMSQMVWGMIWVTPNGHVGRSELVIMERDFTAKKHGYSGDSYIQTLEKGLLPNYLPGHIFMQDNCKVTEHLLVYSCVSPARSLLLACSTRAREHMFA
jgi:hypothetical protein